MKQLDDDLQRILNINAKIYNTKNQKQGKVVDVNDRVHIEYTDNDRDVFEVEAFKQLLVDDIIVSNSRLTMGSGNRFKVRPRAGTVPAKVKVDTTGKKQTDSTKPAPKESTNQPKLETGYINFKTGKFSTESKRGYTKVEYRKSTQKVELELDDDQMRKLKELGLV